MHIFDKGTHIIHPHGVIGSCENCRTMSYGTYQNPSKGYHIRYGDLTKLIKNVNKGDIPFIFPVDDLIGANNNGAYKEANQILSTAKNVLCIGLSEVGIKSSDLDLSKCEVIYYSGKEKVFDNFEPLNMYANEFVGEL